MRLHLIVTSLREDDKGANMDLAKLDAYFQCGNCRKRMHASEGVHDAVTLFIVHAECVTEEPGDKEQG